MQVVRTKKVVPVDGQLGIDKQVYFKLGDWYFGKARTPQGEEVDAVQFQVIQYFKDEDGNDVVMRATNATYRRSTFFSQFGEMTFNAFVTMWPHLMIQQMAFVNSKEWTGNEVQYIRYWNLTADDFEVVEDGLQ
jgi:hypothetical protein